MLGGAADGRIGAAHVLHQRRRADAEPARDPHDRPHLDVLEPALDARHVGEVHAAAVAELLERPPRVLAQPPYLRADHGLRFQASACCGSLYDRSRTGRANRRANPLAARVTGIVSASALLTALKAEIRFCRLNKGYLKYLPDLTGMWHLRSVGL